MRVAVKVLDPCEVLTFAGRELARYLNLIADGPDFCVLVTEERAAEGPAVTLACRPGLFDVPDPRFDDAYRIAVAGGAGEIAGSNPRAVLLGVYRLLTEAGCRFVRPGAEGEMIPRRPLGGIEVELTDRASLRHRGVVIEGGDSIENVLDFIDWLPKLGYNAFFTQFMTLREFFERWYFHGHNPYLRAEPFDEAECARYELRTRQAVARRGLLLHDVGHGWTGMALGLGGEGWQEADRPLAEEARELTAQVGGERGLFQGAPALTNLCLSNPRARTALVGQAVDYAARHPEADCLHFWLADSANSFCECGACREKSPADWYVVLLNELDEALTAAGLDTRVVFLLYLDLLFPPKREAIRHPERFLLMFAPIARPFGESYDALDTPACVPEYVLNATPTPRELGDNLACLRAWRERFAGDGFDFDYWLGRAHYGDPGYCRISRVLCRDVAHLPKMGLGGILSCQELRAFFPTSLPNYALGRMLWNTSTDYEAVAREYFEAAFGERAGAARDYLEELSELFDIDYWFRGCKGERPDVALAMEKAIRRAEAFGRDFEAGPVPENPCHRRSWRLLGLHARYAALFAEPLRLRAEGKKQEADDAWESFADFVGLYEEAFQPELDVFRLLDIARWAAGFPKPQGKPGAPENAS